MGIGFFKAALVAVTATTGSYAGYNSYVADDECYLVLNCAPDVSYHPVQQTPSGFKTPNGQSFVSSVTKHVNEFGWRFDDQARLKFLPVTFEKAWIEFDDAGRAFDENQKNAVLARLSELRAAARAVFVVVYIHGWHQNADDSISDADPGRLGYDAVKFDYFLARQADQLRRLYEQRNLPNVPAVLGVYVGWRADALTNQYIQHLTIGNRAAAADRLGLSKAEDGLYKQLQSLADSARSTSPDSRMFVVGHSLGGRVLSRLVLEDINTAPLSHSGLEH